MASREEEKRLRREERQRAEAAAAASQTRAQRLRYLIGGLLALALVAGAVVLATGGDDTGGGEDGAPVASSGGDGAPIPEPVERDLAAAAEKAGCKVTSPAILPSNHVEGAVKYPEKPPTSGDHSETPALDGIYATGQEPGPEGWLHALEHGRVAFLYKQGSPPELVGQLETLASEPLNGKDGYKSLLLQDTTGMTPAVAAVGWGQLISCPKRSDAMFDALRAFRVKYVDQGPEAGIPPNN